MRKNTACECINSRKTIDSAGIPIYNGQFASNRTSFAASDTDSKQSTRNDASEPIHLKVSQGRTQQKNEKSSAKANDKSAKKRDKKLAWKRKQALLKSSRMKKKGDRPKAA